MQPIKILIFLFALMLGASTTPTVAMDGDLDNLQGIEVLQQFEADHDQAQLPGQHRGTLFLLEVQMEPDYQQLSQLLFCSEHNDSIYPHAPPAQPWYLQQAGSNHRLSGWKDGNSLYRAHITYHS